MNIAIVNPTFMATFVGAPLLASAAAVLSDHRARPWAIAASAARTQGSKFQRLHRSAGRCAVPQ